VARSVPLDFSSGSDMSVDVDGYTPRAGEEITVPYNQVGRGYFATMGIPIVRGRSFDDRDRAGLARVAIVNETMARRYWPDRSPIGQTLRIPVARTPSGATDLALQIVGVAHDAKYVSLAEAPQPFVYRPLAQARRFGVTSLVVRSTRPAALAALVRQTAAEIDPAVPILEMRELAELYRLRGLLPPRLMSQLVSALGAIGLGLAGIGLYGVLAFVTMRRAREFGVRVAVGATPWSVAALVVRQGAVLVVPGLVLGTVLAAALTPLIGAPAFDFVSPNDPIVLAAATLIPAVVSLGAALMPALRASRVDPITTLRVE
jgi:hypothetical protein